MKDFLEVNGYKMWNEEVKETHREMKYQKRIDQDYPDAPLCQCNDKLFININFFDIPSLNSDSYTISLAHENKDGDWCNFEIYGLKEDQLRSKLKSYEGKIVKLWEVFAE